MTPKEFLEKKGWLRSNPIYGGVLFDGICELLDEYASKKETEATFTDPRDGQTYRTVELNGLRWMAQNLNFDVGEGCWFYGNDPKNGEKYGRLYTWEAAMKACPDGWRLPTKVEWQALISERFGDSKKAYSALIEGGSSGFSALLGGYRSPSGSFFSLGVDGYYWSATENGSDDAWIYYFNSSCGRLGRFGNDVGFGFSCRCAQDF